MQNQTPSARAESAADHEAEDSMFYRDVLHELIAMGSEVARMIHGQAKAQDAARYSDEPAPDVTEAFERIARSIRRSIMLARKVAEPLPVVAGRGPHDRVAARQHIARQVERAIDREASDAERPSMRGELQERLDAPDLDFNLDTLPIDEIIINICHDLGLGLGESPTQWKRRTPEDISVLMAQAKAPPGTKLRDLGIEGVFPLRRPPASDPP